MVLLPQHMGALHPVEQLLTWLLAFGPFVVLGIVVLVRRRHEARDEAARDEAARDEAARDEAARDQAARDQAARDQAARDEAARDEARDGQRDR
ncbi:hypothetical protein ACFP3Q_09495 [Nocardioides sp. GCM10027113]|uniref:hypothetical protein n=1 Tax=unclassified Nocardioides TaxID=2615069 RepID=UPI0036166F48